MKAEPVGLQGTRLVISQRPALAVTGWLGVLVLAGCAWWIVAGQQSAAGWLWLPAAVGVLTVTSLVIVNVEP